jgi:phosphoribosylglycinamide formyltransferase-1
MNFAIFTRSDDVRISFILNGLKKRNIKPKVIISSDKPLPRLPLIKRLKKILKNKAVKEKSNFLHNINQNIEFVDTHDSDQTLSILKRYNIKFVFLSKCGIISNNIFKHGIKFINAHPSILPLYRGRGSLEWAVFNGGPLGFTIHYIDENVDTGPIILCKEIFTQKDETFVQYKKRLDLYAINSVCDLLLDIKKNKKINLIHQEKSQGIHFFRKPNHDELSQINKMFTNISTNN